MTSLSVQAAPDPLPWLGRLLASGPSASADLYLGFSCADLIETGRLERHAPTVFRCDRTLIVVRHDGGLSPLPRHDRLIYVIDDDWRGGLHDINLPHWYRAQLAGREARVAQRLEAAADIICVSSEPLAELYRARLPLKRVALLEPAWDRPQADLPFGSERVRELAVLGAATHRADCQWLTPVLEALLDERQDLEILWSDNHSLPRSLQGRDALKRIPVLDWNGYREWIVGRRVHLGLYPLRPGPFNRARSINKLYEYDQLGAAVVASDVWASARQAAQHGACLLLPMDRGAWLRTLLDLIDDPKRVRDIATSNRRWLEQRGLLQQRTAWGRLLPSLETPEREHPCFIDQGGFN